MVSPKTEEDKKNEVGLFAYVGFGACLSVFLYFSKSFFTEIYFRFHNLQFCTPTARLRGGRPPAALLPGGRDLNVNKIYF